jgi:hypothetical protein
MVYILYIIISYYICDTLHEGLRTADMLFQRASSFSSYCMLKWNPHHPDGFDLPDGCLEMFGTEIKPY